VLLDDLGYENYYSKQVIPSRLIAPVDGFTAKIIGKAVRNRSASAHLVPPPPGVFSCFGLHIVADRFLFIGRVFSGCNKLNPEQRD
jgi:hypothetical protein